MTVEKWVVHREYNEPNQALKCSTCESILLAGDAFGCGAAKGQGQNKIAVPLVRCEFPRLPLYLKKLTGFSILRGLAIINRLPAIPKLKPSLGRVKMAPRSLLRRFRFSAFLNTPIRQRSTAHRPAKTSREIKRVRKPRRRRQLVQPVSPCIVYPQPLHHRRHPLHCRPHRSRKRPEPHRRHPSRPQRGRGRRQPEQVIAFLQFAIHLVQLQLENPPDRHPPSPPFPQTRIATGSGGIRSKKPGP